MFKYEFRILEFFKIRGGNKMKVNFGGVEEEVVTREEFPLEKAQRTLDDEVVADLGYGVQGPGQSMNMRDNGINVIIGQRESHSKAGEKQTNWEKSLEDGWIPGKTLFSSLEEATERATIVQYLLSDAGQMQEWGRIKPHLTEGKALYFSHGFSIVYANQTGVVPPAKIDVILVAPKGAGRTVRTNFLNGSGINSSYAVHQDYTGRAEERAKALGISIGSGFLFPTTFQNEVYSDLTGERGVLMGALAGIMEAQYAKLRAMGHSRSEAFNETVEELTQSLIGLVGRDGMDWMYKNCSTTAQVGALEWRHMFRQAVEPVFDRLYQSVADGTEVAKVLRANSDPNYRRNLDTQLDEMRNSEMWQAGAAVRSLRPENQKK